MMPILLKGDDVRSRKKANYACHGWLGWHRSQWINQNRLSKDCDWLIVGPDHCMSMGIYVLVSIYVYVFKITTDLMKTY